MKLCVRYVFVDGCRVNYLVVLCGNLSANVLSGTNRISSLRWWRHRQCTSHSNQKNNTNLPKFNFGRCVEAQNEGPFSQHKEWLFAWYNYYWKDECFTHQESASHRMARIYWRKTTLHTNDPRDVAHKMAHIYRVSSQAFIRIESKGRPVAKYFNHYNAPGRQKLNMQTIGTECFEDNM